MRQTESRHDDERCVSSRIYALSPFRSDLTRSVLFETSRILSLPDQADLEAGSEACVCSD